eukprot:PITA_24339
MGKGYFVFVFENTEDRSLIFRNGPYFVGPQGLYLNKWTPDFNPSQDVPSVAPVWVRLPHLPLHCWNQNSFQIIKNALGKYIDQATDPPNKAQENEDHVEAPPSKEGGVTIQIEASQGSPRNPTYAEVTKKKAVESSESSEEELLERPLKRSGRKSRKEKREEEAKRLKAQGSQSTIEMTIGRNSKPRSSKGGSTPLTEIIHLASKLAISLVNLYVLVNYSEKRDCWSSLAAFLEQETHNNIILAGDLNIILKAKEKIGGTNSKDPMVVVVEELAQKWDLQDFNPIQGLFSWSNNQTGTEHISGCLDRFLVQTSLLMNKKIITTKFFPKLSSDHKPI